MAIHGLYMRVDNYLLTVMILQVLSAGVSLMNLTGANGREWQKSTCSHSALKKTVSTEVVFSNLSYQGSFQAMD